MKADLRLVSRWNIALSPSAINLGSDRFEDDALFQHVEFFQESARQRVLVFYNCVAKTYPKF